MSNSTRKILKSLKNVSFKQEDFIMIGEFEIPIVSRSIGESNKIMTSLLSSIKTKVPKKTRYANAEEVELLKKKDPQMKGFAHGFSVLSDFVIVNYKCDSLYQPSAERGILYNDPELNIDWKIDLESAIISAKDKVNPTLSNAEINFLYGKQ